VNTLDGQTAELHASFGNQEGDGEGAAKASHRATLLWAIAVVITIGAAAFQRVTGPTFPVSGSITIGNQEVPFRFDRSHGGSTDAPVQLQLVDTSVSGVLEWKQDGNGGRWTTQIMRREGEGLAGWIPCQSPGSLLRYRVALLHGAEKTSIPSDEGILLRFKRDVPIPLLIAHIVAMFAAILLSTRAGLDCFSPTPSLRTFTLLATTLFAVGGILFGALVQKYAFDVYWTGWPMGHDMTDNKTALALAFWIAAAAAKGWSKGRRGWVMAASSVSLAAFLIPHSVTG